MSRVVIWGAIGLVVVVPAVIWAADVSPFYVFAPGTAIRAAEVNSNFEAVRGVRFTFTGGSARRDEMFYETALAHPFLDGNPDAIVHVSVADFGRFAACAQATGGSSPYMFLAPEYSAGRWVAVGTCPGARYSVIAFRAAH